MTEEIELIKRLCSGFGVSAREESIAEIIKEEIGDVSDGMFTDRMGNLIAVMRFGDLKSPDRMRLMFSAHMDEVGFMITELRDDGYLGFDTVGGISTSVLAGRRVYVLGKNGFLNGVIASKAIHHKNKDERQKALEVDKLYIDIGAKNKEELLAHVRVGDFATFDSEFYTFGNDMVKGKALDDRMGCAAMIESMRILKGAPVQRNLDAFFCFTVREEIGLSGAKAASLEVKPDYAVVLETTAVADVADTAVSKRVAELGKGVAISFMDRSTVYDRSLVDAVVSIAKKNDITVQLKRYVSGGNDAGVIHKTADGIRTVTMSVPTRYLHSPACVANINDYLSQKNLCVSIAKELV